MIGYRTSRQNPFSLYAQGAKDKQSLGIHVGDAAAGGALGRGLLEKDVSEVKENRNRISSCSINFGPSNIDEQKNDEMIPPQTKQAFAMKKLIPYVS